MVLKLRKLVDQRYKWRSRGLSDFILHMKNRLAQISSQDQLCFFKGPKVRGQGLLGRRWNEPPETTKANRADNQYAKDLHGPFSSQNLDSARHTV